MACPAISMPSWPRWGSSTMSEIDPRNHDPLPPQQPPPKHRLGLWRTLGFLLGGTVAAFGTKNIVEGARTIGSLADRIKAGPAPDRRVRTDDERYLDMQATAFLAGTSASGLDRLLANRRRQSARATKCYLAGGIGFFAFWFYEAFVSPVYASLPYVLGLIALCSVFFLSAFHNALINWQVRTRRLGTAREFFNANETWWPS